MVGIEPHSRPARPIAWYPIGAPLILGLATLITYWRVVRFDFVRWDDDINITLNPLLTADWSWGLVQRFFDADQALRFKPLHWLFDRLLHDAFGFDPTAWHAVNLLLHVVVTVLFYFVVRRLIHLLAPAGKNSRSEILAALGAAGWALHPLRAEVVAWATASTYAFTAIWLLGSFACYLEFIASPRRARLWLALSWILATAAYASYPVSLTYGVFLIVVDGWLQKRVGRSDASTDHPSRARMARYVMFLLPAVVATGFTLWSRFAHPGMFTDAPSVEAVGLGSRITAAFASLVFIVWRLVWVSDLTPNVRPLAAMGDGFWLAFILGVVALGILVIAWRRRDEYPGLAVTCFAFAALSLPCLGLTELPTWPVDRYSYLAHLPLIAGLTCFAAVHLKTANAYWPAVLMAVIAIGGGAFGAARQCLIWRDSEALFTHMMAAPSLAHNPRQKGHIYILWARYEASVGRSARGLELLGRAHDVYLSATRAAVGRGDYEEALTLSTHLERYFPIDAVVHRERGSWLLRLSRPAQALVELRAARAAMPDDARAGQLLREAETRAKLK